MHRWGKLSKSPFVKTVRFCEREGSSESESERVPTLDDDWGRLDFQEALEGEGSRVVEVAGLQAALLERYVCRECDGGPREELYRREGK